MGDDVFDWVSAPAPLNEEKAGRKAVFVRDDKSAVERRDAQWSWKGCVCYTLDPLPVGQVWRITIQSTNGGSSYESLVSDD